MSEWIKCSERMPEDDVDVYAFYLGMQSVLYVIDGVWCDGFYRVDIKDVTHWHPLLPSPPQD